MAALFFASGGRFRCISPSETADCHCHMVAGTRLRRTSCTKRLRLYTRLVSSMPVYIRTSPIYSSSGPFIVFCMKPNTCSIRQRIFDFSRLWRRWTLSSAAALVPFSWMWLLMAHRLSLASVCSLAYALSPWAFPIHGLMNTFRIYFRYTG